MSGTERWAAVEGFEGYYEVSDHGRVRSLDRTIQHPRGGATRRRGKILSLHRHKGGYRSLDLSREGVATVGHVHRLVAVAFVPGRAPGLDVLHTDGDTSNNVASNLRWGTHGENMLDMVGHGTHNQARKTHCPQMHAYDTANTYLDPTGRRHCRSCRRQRDRTRSTN